MYLALFVLQLNNFQQKTYKKSTFLTI